MADVNINKFRASVVRDGSKPASPGFIVSEGQDPVDPAGNGQNHLPVTIATAATGLSITDSQVLGGAGTVGQYIRGDGSLADFPQASGGGSSVNYYLNGSISQGTIGGVAYKELNKVPILGAGTDFTINADGYIASFLTDAGDPNLLEIPGGNWNFETYFSASSSGGSPSFYVELYKYDGTTFTLIASSSSSPELIAFGTNLNPYFSTLAVPTTTLALTDRLAVRYYVTHSGRTITLHTENNHLCQVVTTFTTGLTSLNGLTAQVQNLAVGTSGTDFNIASAIATHTFNLPTASATNRGALSSADWTTFNNKQNALGYVPVPETRTITINGVSQDLSANRTYNVGTVTSVGLSSATSGVTIGGSPVTGVGAFTLAIATASGSQNGLLSSTDWTTFNSKQNALTNPVTGTGVSGRVAYWNGTNSITSDADLLFDGSNLTVGGNVLVGSTQIIGINTVDGADNGYLAICGASADGSNRGGHIYLSGNERAGDAGSVVIAGGNTSSGTGATAAIVFRTLGTDKARFTSAGNFGIGTDTPVTFGTKNLDVNGGAGSAYIVARGSNNAGTVEMAFDGAGYIGTKTAHDLIIRTSDLQRINIFATSGNVLIGGSGSDNGARLQVSGTATISGATSLISSTPVFNLTSTSASGYSEVYFYRNTNSLTAYISSGVNENVTASGDAFVFDNRISGGNMVFRTNGGSGATERLRIASTGAATFSGSVTALSLDVISASGVGSSTASGLARFITAGTTTAISVGQANSARRLDISSYSVSTTGEGLYLSTLSNHAINFVTNSLDRAIITSSGNVGIGTASPSAAAGLALAMNSGANQCRIALKTSSTGDASGAGLQIGIAGIDAFIEQRQNAALTFATNASERMRITSSGNVLINSTGVSSQGEIFFVTATNLAAMFRTTGGAANNWAANFWNNATSGNNLFIEFGTETGFTGRGSVTYNRGSGVVAYNTTSDYRIKTEIQDFNAFDIINNLKPKKFKIGDAKQKSIGFIAHELQEFFPQAVHGEKDAIDSNNKPIYQGVDYSQLTGLLVKAIQELKQEIDTLKN